MKTSEVLQAWLGILAGRRPSLSIEITKKCPLRCSGCYAFDPAHLGGDTELRQLSDFKGAGLVKNVLAVVDRYKPLHVSLRGGDPLVRYRLVYEHQAWRLGWPDAVILGRGFEELLNCLGKRRIAMGFKYRS